MPSIRSMAAQNVYLAPEASPGTAQTTGFVGVPGIRMTPGWDGDREIFRGGSGKVATVTIGTDEVSPWDTEVAACFNHIGFPLASRFGLPTTTTPGGGTNSRQHVFTINPTAEDLYRAYTALWGDGYLGLRGVYGYFNNLSVDISRGETKIGADFRSRAVQSGFVAPTSEVQTLAITGSPASGTFTITLPFAIGGSATTGAIQYNATASAVKSAIVAIAGNKFTTEEVDVTGGPGPGTAWVITFKGRYAQQNLAAITTTNSFTGGSSPNTTITETTPGAKPTDTALAPFPSNMWNVFIDPTYGALGTTQYGGAYTCKLDFGDKFDEDAPLNSSIISYEKPIEKQEQDDMFDMTLRLDDTALAQFLNMASGTTQYMRIGMSTAPAGAVNPYYIEGSIPYQCYFDLPVQIVSRGKVDKAPNSSVTVVDLSLAMVKDGSGNYAKCTLVNTVTSY